MQCFARVALLAQSKEARETDNKEAKSVEAMCNDRDR